MNLECQLKKNPFREIIEVARVFEFRENGVLLVQVRFLPEKRLFFSKFKTGIEAMLFKSYLVEDKW